jgi:DNA polymerase (family 10)
MNNKQLADFLGLYSKLLELHNLNPFKAKAFANAAFKITRYPENIFSLTTDEILSLDGIGKSIAEKINEIKQHNIFAELKELVDATPNGLFDLLKIKGLGPKKIAVIWKELGIESIGELLYACNENRLITLKGFGAKTQNEIINNINFLQSNQGKFHFAAIKNIADNFVLYLTNKYNLSQIQIVGELRRMCNVIQKAEILIAIENNIHTLKNETFPLNIDFEIHTCKPENFDYNLFKLSAHLKHLEKNNLPFIPPQMREGGNEFEWTKKYAENEIVNIKDIKGILHVHTTYSDGLNTLEQMANYCKENGFHYIGISDHSQTAVYANGLKTDEILKQHKEIEQLNKKLFPFKIFKGIESDILSDGKLDYPTEILSLFDFVIASVHSGLKMNEEKATERLIKAIENPYTTMLGHPSGRLLLSRKSYPLNYKKIIDACAVNNVVIELNANPYRLDIDWRWLYYAMNKNVLISINPDAHQTQGLKDLQYGIYSAQKGGLTREYTFNAFSLEKIEQHFLQKKSLHSFK